MVTRQTAPFPAQREGPLNPPSSPQSGMCFQMRKGLLRPRSLLRDSQRAQTRRKNPRFLLKYASPQPIDSQTLQIRFFNKSGSAPASLSEEAI